MTSTPAVRFVSGLLGALLLSGCTEYQPGATAATPAGSSPLPTVIVTPAPMTSPSVSEQPSQPQPDALTLGAATVSGPLGTEPQVDIKPKAKPASKLLIADIVTGDGAAVAPGGIVTAHYVGYGAASGQMFDSSWQRGEPATFPLDQVIVGWQQGLVGMKVGGRRVLVIPGAQAYGDTPPEGAGILPGETLVFVVDLVATQ